MLMSLFEHGLEIPKRAIRSEQLVPERFDLLSSHLTKPSQKPQAPQIVELPK